MSRIRRALRIDPDTLRTARDHLDRHVAPDVSYYARGRQRAWLEIEAPLGPTQPWRSEIDRARNSPNGRPGDPVSLDLNGGEVLAFDCKHQHRVVDPDPSRWSIVLWRLKRHPIAPVPATLIP